MNDCIFDRYYLNMKLKKEHTVAQIAELIGGKFVGDPNHLVIGLNEIHRVESGDLMFVDHPKYYQKALDSAATTILIDQEVECPDLHHTEPPAARADRCRRARLPLSGPGHGPA